MGRLAALLVAVAILATAGCYRLPPLAVAECPPTGGQPPGGAEGPADPARPPIDAFDAERILSVLEKMFVSFPRVRSADGTSIMASFEKSKGEEGVENALLVVGGEVKISLVGGRVEALRSGIVVLGDGDGGRGSWTMGLPREAFGGRRVAVGDTLSGELSVSASLPFYDGGVIIEIFRVITDLEDGSVRCVPLDLSTL
jgi:hypothetical protein